MSATDDVEKTAGLQRSHTNEDALRALEGDGQPREVEDEKSVSNEDVAEKGGEQVVEKEDDGVPQRSKGKIAVIMFALCMAVFLAALDVTIVTTALPTISEHFHSSAGYTWIGSAFLLANAASIPSWGKVSDIFGRKPMLLLANIIFMVGSLIAALSNSIGMLIAARAIQGIGGGGLVILVNITIGDLFSLRSRGAFYGIIGGVWAIASSIGPIIGGAFTEGASWRWCFYINLPLDGIAFFVLLFFLDLKTPRTPVMDGLKAIDWVGSITIVGATLMFLFGLQYGGVTFPWDSAAVICLIVFGIATFCIFLFWEYRYAKYPIMTLELFSNPTNIATLIVVFVHGFVFISGSYYLPLYFQAILGATPVLSGVYLLPTALSLSVSSIATGIFIKKVGKYRPPIWIALVLLTAGYGLFINLDASSGWAKIILYQVVAGLGTGPLFQSPLIALQAHINPRDIATATSTFGLIRQLATSTSVVLGQVVFQNSMNKKSAILQQELGPQLAGALSGANAGANVELIAHLPPEQRSAARTQFALALQPMWIMYVCVSAFGLIVSAFIQKKVLTKEHAETKTGLDAEAANAAQRKQERDFRHESKRQSKAARQSQASVAAHSLPDDASQGDGSRPPTSSGTTKSAEKRSSKWSLAKTPESGASEHTGGEEVPPVPALPSQEHIQQQEASRPVSRA
ncbi:MFS general substrate transporter [Polychaeton citri CBS 116435]|uniref:Efflux pump dotC n=1 Tax=Polychaeton citri CBS 116435 TaxID=1314669 RepID=A0A9P4QBE5_9PEZI|nr:MFS general substrate transporter [Polychaeton citri CBS 116435]